MQQSIIRQGYQELRSRLPANWRLDVRPPEEAGEYRFDGIVDVVSPTGARATLLVEAKKKVGGSVAAGVLEQLRRGSSPDRRYLVLAEYIGALARDRFRAEGVNYLDLTGNCWVVLDEPAVFISTAGAESDPEPVKRPVQSLKGAKAARLVRALCDWMPPVGVRELARRAGTDAGYATRVLSLLQEDALVVRDRTGTIADVKWPDLLRRWVQDYALMTTNRAIQFVASRGLQQLEKALRSQIEIKYAVTASRAVPPQAEIAPTRLLTCFVENIEEAASVLRLTPSDAGANVVLLEPFDPVIWERARSVDGLILTALTQCVADLLGGSGREPNQGEALIEWMIQNEPQWRA